MSVHTKKIPMMDSNGVHGRKHRAPAPPSRRRTASLLGWLVGLLILVGLRGFYYGVLSHSQSHTSYYVVYNNASRIGGGLVALEEVEDDAEVSLEACAVNMAFPGVAPFPQTPRSVIYKPIVDGMSADACAEALGIDKVAMLFLSKGVIHHHLFWRQWFASAAGKIPREKGCSSDGRVIEDSACQHVLNPEFHFDDPVQYQVLFSLYVHAPPGMERHMDSFFRKYLIPRQVQVAWGEHSMIYATRELLWYSFKDPRNTRFVLLSESDLPLYGPSTFYYQLMKEQKSRIDTTNLHPVDSYRWHFRFLCGDPPIKEKDWRKSSQWFSLIRKHVGIILNDTGVYRTFEKYCTSFYDDVSNYYRVCYSDEHYIPVLLAVSRVEHETHPNPNGITDVDWSHGGEHPWAYTPSQIQKKLFYAKLRVTYDCIMGVGSQRQFIESIERIYFAHMFDSRVNASASSVTLNTSCTPLEEEQEEEEDTHDETAGNQMIGMLRSTIRKTKKKRYVDLGPSCALTARKFKADTKQAVLDLFRDPNNLGIIDARVIQPFKDWYQNYEERRFKSFFFGSNEIKR